MPQQIWLNGSLVGSVPSAIDIALAVQKILPPTVDLTPVLTAITALKADLDSSVATIEAQIRAIPTSPPPPPPPPPVATKFPATGPDAAFMPWVTPASTPTTPWIEYPNPPGNGPVSSPTTIPAGVYGEVIDLVNDTTVSGAGMVSQVGAAAATIFDISGLRPIYEKAVIVAEASATAAGATASQMTLSGAAISQADGQNAAGGSNGAVGYNVTWDHIESYGNQQGLRGLGGNITITNCYIHHNGTDSCNSTGCTHNVYLNEAGTAAQAAGHTNTITNSIFRKALFAHEYKTRQPSTTATGCVFDSTPIPGSSGSYSGGVSQLGGNGSCFDNANGGAFVGNGNIYIKGAGANDRNIITHAADAEGVGPWNGNYIETNGVFVNLTGQTVYIVNDGGTVTLVNPTYIGAGTLQTMLSGNYVVQGTVTNLPATTPIPFPASILVLVGGTYPT